MKSCLPIIGRSQPGEREGVLLDRAGCHNGTRFEIYRLTEVADVGWRGEAHLTSLDAYNLEVPSFVEVAAARGRLILAQ